MDSVRPLAAAAAAEPLRRHPLTKVPQVTAAFWITKVLTTGMGETTSDTLVHRFDPVLAVAIGGVGLAAALALQLIARRFDVWRYWLAVLMVSVFGTMAADGVHVELGIPYAVSTVLAGAMLAATFAAWYWSERTLSIHSIFTRRRELFYWATVLVTFALGTAAGDMTATTLHLGYLASGVLFTAAIAVPALAGTRLGMGGVLTFWCAYVLTRPVGASFADWIGVSHARGGLDLGTGTISVVLFALIAGMVTWMAVTRDGVRERPAPASRP